MASNEPLAVAVARNNVKAHQPSSAKLVGCLLDRIDELERRVELSDDED